MVWISFEAVFLKLFWGHRSLGNLVNMQILTQVWGWGAESMYFPKSC